MGYANLARDPALVQQGQMIYQSRWADLLPREVSEPQQLDEGRAESCKRPQAAFPAPMRSFCATSKFGRRAVGC
jgi:hypothetical protein